MRRQQILQARNLVDPEKSSNIIENQQHNMSNDDIIIPVRESILPIVGENDASQERAATGRA